MLRRGDYGREEPLEEVKPIPGRNDYADARCHLRLSDLAALSLRGRLRRVGHLLKQFKAAMASNHHERVMLFDNRVSRRVKDHLAAAPLDGYHDHVKV